MQSINVRIVFLCLFLSCVSALNNCGEWEKNEVIRQVLEKDSKPLPYQKEIDQLFDAFDENNSQRMEEIYKYLANVTIDEYEEPENSEYAGKRIKYVPDRIRSHGYPAEDHEIVTDDGYILHVYRLPYGKKSAQTDKVRPPILIMHGLLEASNSWVALGPDHSLAYLLADAGYDVWLGNARGTEPSRDHVRLRPNGLFQKAYWSFSWHEIGVYELPAIIDHILGTTKQEKLNYIGFSQGTTSFFVMTSMRPDYNDKILDAHLMAPVANLKDQRATLFNVLAKYYVPFKRSLQALRTYKFTLNNYVVSKIADGACKRSQESTPFACKLVMSILGSNQINCTSLPDIFLSTPAGASVRQCLHYLQMINGGEFNQFDYENARINKKKYGRPTPPPYDLSKITAPINIYYSKDDDTATAENAVKLFPQLRNLKSTYLVAIEDFQHMYIFSVHSPLIELTVFVK